MDPHAHAQALERTALEAELTETQADLKRARAAVEGRGIIERLAEDFAVRFVDGRKLGWEVYPGV